MTGVFSFANLHTTLGRVLNVARRENRIVGIIHADIDGCAAVNYEHGHRVGDELIVQLARVVELCLAQDEFVGRVAGDEFVVVLPAAPSVQAIVSRAEQIRQSIEHVRVEAEPEYFVSVTMTFGVAFFPRHGEDANTVIAAAEEASYEGKVQGKGRVSVAR